DAAVTERKLAVLTDERDKLLLDIRTADPQYANLREGLPLAPTDIQQLLDDETVLLEYAFSDQRGYVFAVTRSSIQSYALATREQVEKAAALVRRMLTAHEPPKAGENASSYLSRLRDSAAGFQQAVLELSRIVLGPIKRPLGANRLLIVADGPLQYLPFEILATPAPNQPTAGEYSPLLLQNEIVYLPSASTAALLRNDRGPKMKSVAVLADPVFDSDDERLPISSRRQDSKASRRLPGELTQALRDVGDVGDKDAEISLERLRYTAQEADSITATAPAGSWMKAVGFKANRATALSNELSQYRIVHFATHGILNDEHPGLSGIVLSLVDEHGWPENGFLRLGEIYGLNLPVDLVVLSACKTGLGKQVRGEGLIGLTRAFMYAGSARVVASLWKVDDEATAELMKRFYRNLLGKKMPAASALRKAKIELSGIERWRMPYYWAGFILQGDWK
ncbi:MAG TPA: CHAT domain-containing protein, partial [Blastocatellia bacterium]|nr:CHAT domain-containing protein [Blastocatellia bacterium]